MKVLVDELKERAEKIKLGKCEKVTNYPLHFFFISTPVKLVLLTACIKNFIVCLHYLKVRSDVSLWTSVCWCSSNFGVLYVGRNLQGSLAFSYNFLNPFLSPGITFFFNRFRWGRKSQKTSHVSWKTPTQRAHWQTAGSRVRTPALSSVVSDKFMTLTDSNGKPDACVFLEF